MWQVKKTQLPCSHDNTVHRFYFIYLFIYFLITLLQGVKDFHFLGQMYIEKTKCIEKSAFVKIIHVH